MEIKVLAYADHVAVVCRNRNLQPIFDEYERLSKISGLVLNADKTEVLNLIESDNNLSVIRYQNQVFSVSRVDSVRICGLQLSRQPEADYRVNIEGAISKMERIVSSWRKRALSLNGRMLAAKTFVLSQIVFQSQATIIAVKEIKKIERLIYSFVNGAKSLYGPERIARRRLKAAKDQGGINGVDVASFIRSIQIRQFNKASIKSRSLGALQLSLRGQDDDLSQSVISFLRSHYREKLKVGIPDLQQIAQISSIPLKFLLSPDTRASAVALNSSISSLYELQNAIRNSRIPRAGVNMIFRQLPAVIRTLLRSQVIVDSQLLAVLTLEEGILSTIDSFSAVRLRQGLMELKFPSSPVRAKEVYKEDLWQEPEGWQGRLWQIGNPQLRAYRLKLLYKDIFSNERRHKFGLSDSPDCIICGQIESVNHQFVECANARKLWDMYRRLTGKSVDSLLQAIICVEEIDTEIVKSIIIKRLIQIDRSRNINLACIKQEILHYYRVEACLSKSLNATQRWNRRMREIEQS